MIRLSLVVGFTVCLFAPGAIAQEKDKPTRIGIIGLDTSHVVAFTQLLNNPNAKGDLAGFRVVAAFPGGSPDVVASHTRIEGFTKTLREQYKVEIVSSIDELLKQVDAVLLESVDGRPHLKQALPVFKAGKRMFIDKPFSGSLADAIQIAALSKEHKSPCFSSSSLRYYPGVRATLSNPKVGKVIGCTTWGPCSLEEHHPDLFWYGIHGVETLFTVMGTGCESVSRVHTKGTDVAVGTWKDGRVGTFRGIRDGSAGYGLLAFGEKGIDQPPMQGGFEPLVVEICKFFRTGIAPVSLEETVELMAFMEAADESKRLGGGPVKIAAVMEKARKELASRGGK